jgi:hypothetical protein
MSITNLCSELFVIHIRMLFYPFHPSICSYRHQRCLANSRYQYWICHYVYGDQYLYWWFQYVPYQGTGYQFAQITKTSMYWAQKRRYTPSNGCQYRFWHARTGIGGPHWHWHLNIQPSDGMGLAIWHGNGFV